METAAPMEKWKNELHVFPLSHKRLENSSQKSRDEFSTVPTASTTGLCLKKEKKECDISNELKHVTFLKSFDTFNLTKLKRSIARVNLFVQPRDRL